MPPDDTSISESSPNPISAMLPATAPEIRATTASSRFHTTVKYSRLRPRWMLAARVVTICSRPLCSPLFFLTPTHPQICLHQRPQVAIQHTIHVPDLQFRA